MKSADINDYLAEIMGEEFTAKDFRTWHATVLCAVALAVSTHAPTSESARKRAVARAVKETAEHLGNTPAVCRSSYIDPRVIDRYNDGRTIRAALDKLGEDSADGELATHGPVEQAVLLRLTRSVRTDDRSDASCQRETGAGGSYAEGVRKILLSPKWWGLHLFVSCWCCCSCDSASGSGIARSRRAAGSRTTPTPSSGRCSPGSASCCGGRRCGSRSPARPTKPARRRGRCHGWRRRRCPSRHRAPRRRPDRDLHAGPAGRRGRRRGQHLQRLPRASSTPAPRPRPAGSDGAPDPWQHHLLDLQSVEGALLRYRIVALIVSVLLVVLFGIGIPLQYAGGHGGVDAVVGVVHGVFFYPLYILLTAGPRRGGSG